MLLSSLLLFTAAAGPEQAHGLRHDTPAATWDEALPLGNGTLGALVWGDGAPLNISLDRTDLWDLRAVPEFGAAEYDYETMRRWEREGRHKDLIALYETPYHRPAPTKIPAGRIELRLGGGAFQEAALDIATAQALVSFDNGHFIGVWVHATDPVGVFGAKSDGGFDVALRAPAFGGKEAGPAKPAIVAGELSQLGYPPPALHSGPGWTAYEQEGHGGFRFAVCVVWDERAPGMHVGAWSIATSREGAEPLQIAKRRADAALVAGPDWTEAHHAWWRAWWDQARVEIPHPEIARQYHLDMYKFGAATRHGAPPITLQGPWTADDGKLPPWKGDYHHDLNTQLSYWPAYTGNRLEEGLAFLDWLWDTRDNCRAWTGRFYKRPGLNVPMSADLNNSPIGGWRQYTMSATTSAWLAHHFYLHWQFSADRGFLRDRAYPYLREVAVFLEAMTDERDPQGLRTLPLSSSPEIHDNKPEAWFPTITNYDLALIRWCFLATAELAGELGRDEDAAHWRAREAELPPFALGDDGRLLVAAGHPLDASHRHFSHLMAIHPLGLIDARHGADARRTVEATLADLANLGTDWWTGYSFAWEANVAARAGDGARAARALEIFAEAFVLRNSFHVNGDQTQKGYSNFRYRPFTLEGNFAAAAGLHEMLLQSHTGVIEVFPAIPDDWRDAAFQRLRARGAFLVSATRKDGAVTLIQITAERGGAARLKSPWTGDILEINLPPGASQTLTPPAPPAE